MGDTVDLVLDGLLCEGCLELFEDRDAPGYPRRCGRCGGSDK